MPASAQAPQVFKTVSATRTVEANNQLAFLVRCPPGYHAVSGAVTDPAGTTLIRMAPIGKGSYRFVFSNSGFFASDQKVTVTVRCVRRRVILKLNGSSFRLPIKTRRTRPKTVTVPAGGEATVTTRCPKGYAPVGQGISQVSSTSRYVAPGARTADAGGVLGVAMAGVAFSRGRIRYRLRSTGEAQRAAVRSKCLARRARSRRKKRGRNRGRRAVARIRVIRETFDTDIEQGRNDDIRRSCERGHVALTVGHSFPPGKDVFLASSYPGPRSIPNGDTAALRQATWNIFSAEPGTHRIRLSYLCLDLEIRGRLSPRR